MRNWLILAAPKKMIIHTWIGYRNSGSYKTSIEESYVKWNRYCHLILAY